LIHSNQINAQRVKTQGDIIFREIEMLIADAETNDSVKLYLSADEPLAFVPEMYKRLSEKFLNYPLIYKYIHSIYIYSERGERVFSSGNYSIKDFTDIGWLEKYNTSSHKKIIWPRKINNAYPYVISFMKKTSAYKGNGAIIVNINIKELGEMIGSIDEDAQDIFIIDDDGMVLYSDDREQWFINMNEDAELKKLINTQTQNSLVKKERKNVYSVTNLKSEHYHWTYSTVRRLNEYSKNVVATKRIITLIILILLILSILISTYMTLSLYRPVENIIEVLERPERWSGIKSKKGSNEVKYIAEKIITTVNNNYALQKELERRLELLNTAHIKALQAQLNPHFLRNALNLINLLIIDELGEEHVSSKMLDMVSKLLSYTLEMNKTIVNIKEEIMYTRMYVDILKERYQDVFVDEWEIDREVLENKMLKLCLQPLIENAIYHGICPKGEGGVLKITGKQQDDCLIFCIIDNGVGIPVDRLEKLRTDINGKTFFDSQHVGIRNVNQRIKLMFGENYGVWVDSEEHKGTTVTVTLPVIVQEHSKKLQ